MVHVTWKLHETICCVGTKKAELTMKINGSGEDGFCDHVRIKNGRDNTHPHGACRVYRDDTISAGCQYCRFRFQKHIRHTLLGIVHLIWRLGEDTFLEYQ
eukprot:GHVU01129003.1.p1 GENE.GHVU01129003.1~~GHVU01129003.1.p1  ORF type:complete len:100 (+),score=0.87 GHVU01129003.1:109-408(+)